MSQSAGEGFRHQRLLKLGPTTALDERGEVITFVN
jgi:hypothetical protein